MKISKDVLDERSELTQAKGLKNQKEKISLLWNDILNLQAKLLNLMFQAAFFWYSPRPKRRWAVAMPYRTSTAVTGRTFGGTCNIPPYYNIDVAGFQRLATSFLYTTFIILDRRITCNRKDLQQSVGRSSAFVLPPGVRSARLFNFEAKAASKWVQSISLLDAMPSESRFNQVKRDFLLSDKRVAQFHLRQRRNYPCSNGKTSFDLATGVISFKLENFQRYI